MPSIGWPLKFNQLLPGGFSFDLLLVKKGKCFLRNYWTEVELPNFYMGKYPVTQAFWLSLVEESNPSQFKHLDCPVENINWYEAIAFCNLLNKQCGYSPRYYCDAELDKVFDFESFKLQNSRRSLEIFLPIKHWGYRLPSEAAWTYAAMGAKLQSSFKYSGGNTLDELGWFGQNSNNHTQPIGLKMPNELGLFDMSGNVWEWCEDQWHASSEGTPKDGSAWIDREHMAYKVVKGGAWFNSARRCHNSFRYAYPPDHRDDSIGFRIAFLPSPDTWTETGSLVDETII